MKLITPSGTGSGVGTGVAVGVGVGVEVGDAVGMGDEVFGVSVGPGVGSVVSPEVLVGVVAGDSPPPQPASMAPVIHRASMTSEILCIPAFSILN
ncbi:MAG: hypothetical protein CEE40_06600 [Chloroflexi bacterium B3_Chlor]|nr:MAG: hypothetical protein CEE40_06600 [Chloroflexi bacterium B3_Chlor]